MVIPCEFRNIRISQPCTLTTVFYMKTRHRVDLTNLLSAIHDVLVKAGVIADDNSSIVTSVDGSCVVYRPEQSGIDVIINEVKK